MNSPFSAANLDEDGWPDEALEAEAWRQNAENGIDVRSQADRERRP